LRAAAAVVNIHQVAAVVLVACCRIVARHLRRGLFLLLPLAAAALLALALAW
jgi:hypothetical protein